MTEVRALRLRLIAPEGWTTRAVARTEEALRLAADEPRLVVLRRLDLGRLPLAAPPAQWQARAADRVAAMGRAAVHAATPNAERAVAVWFASAAEARSLLLGELAAGRTPLGWFWGLAVPEWRGATLASWLQIELAAAAYEPQRFITLASAMVRVAAMGRLASLAAALPSGAVASPSVSTTGVSTFAAGRPIGGRAARTAGSTSWRLDQARIARLADALLARLDGIARAAIHQELRRLPADRLRASLLARLSLVAAAPELAGQPGVLIELAAAVVAAAESSETAPERRPALMPGDTPEPRITLVDAMAILLTPVLARTQQPSGVVSSRQFVRPDGTTSARAISLRCAERASAAAGLWLLVRPLARLGFGDWLTAHPTLAAAGFARGLLRHIAQRQRTAADDPVFMLLPEPVMPIDSAVFDLWRVGIDRWLRRRVRRKLADVVRRNGWLMAQATEVRVRFRLDQADIALRTRALDVDPGWTAWLGLTIAYDYRDEAWP